MTNDESFPAGSGQEGSGGGSRPRSEPPTGGGPVRSRAAQAWARAAGILALVAQLLVLALAYLMGLSFSQIWPWAVGVGQAIVGVAVVGWLMARRRWAPALLVPVVSFAAIFAMLRVDTVPGQVTGCSERERALAGELAPAPDVAVELRGGPANTCSARFTTALTSEEFIDHYRSEFETHGWHLITGPGRYGGPEDSIAAVKDGVVVEAVLWHEGGGVDGIFVYERPAHLDVGGCSESEVEAITQLAEPAGVPAGTVTPWGETGVGCVSRFSVPITTSAPEAALASIVDHYRAALVAAGRSIGEETVGTDAARLEATDGGVRVGVLVELYPVGIPRSQEPREVYVELTAFDEGA